MKKIAVIGPDERSAQAVASQLTRCKAVLGAGPQDGVDAVVAVVGPWTPEDQRVVDAVSQAMGAVMLYRPRGGSPSDEQHSQRQRAWANQPGVYHCATVADVQEAVDSIVLNKQRWAADARRADLERSERVRVSVKLEMNRVASEIINDPTHNNEAAHRAFTQRLRLAILRQGVSCPSIPVQVEGVSESNAEGRTQQFIALAVGAVGGLAVGFAVGRGTGNVLVGVLAGLLCAALGAMARVWMVRHAESKQRAAHRAVALKEAWSVLTTDVLTRVQIPRVADAVGGQ